MSSKDEPLADHVSKLADDSSGQADTINTQGLHRRLNNRQVQLIAIGASIGTALFVSIGNGLAAGGPASLLITFSLYSMLLACVNNCIAEMTVYQPVAGGFIRLAGKWYDDALGFMVGWNFFFYEALMVPFEITAINLVLSYWRDDIPVAAVCVACIVLYGLLNALAVGVFGEAEFWLSSGKVILIFILFGFTFVTMVGGNPDHAAYGFRYWNTPGPFAEYLSSGHLGRFEGLLSSLWTAAFTIVGPEYISIAAAEVAQPRIILSTAFKTIYWRFALFFVMGALCVGIVVPWNDPTLQAIFKGESAAVGAAASPYVVAMANLKVRGLPHIINALLITSIFSAGNTLTYCATRSLYSLALDGRAPTFLKKTSKGVPIYAFAVVMCFPLLSLLQLSNDSSMVITWLVSLITAGALIDFLVMCITYLNFYKACQVQGIDRKKLPYTGYFQPYCAWIGVFFLSFVLLFYGYTAFRPWSVELFFQNYTMQLIAPILFFGWKFFKKSKIVKPDELDILWEAPAVDAYEATFESPPPGFWDEILGMFMFREIGRFTGRRCNN